MKVICKQCHQEFELTDADIRYFTSRNLNIPKRCKRCRDVNKRLKNQSSVSYEETNDIYLYKKITIIIALVAISIMISIFFYVKSTETSSSGYIPPVQNTTQSAFVYTTTSMHTKMTYTTTTTCTSVSETTTTTTVTEAVTYATVTYYLNTLRKKFHRPDCDSVQQMNPQNKKAFYGTREEAIENGYSPCKNCNP